MDDARFTSPPAIRVYDPNPSFDRRYSNNSSRPSVRTSVTPFSSRGSMPIPNARSDPAPPPLPPPSFIPDIAHGHDAGWLLANGDSEGRLLKQTLAPIKQGSSLNGGYILGPLNTRRKSGDQGGDLQSHQSYPDTGTISAIPSPLQANMEFDSLRRWQQERPNPTSPSSIANQRLQGEKPLAQKSRQHFSEAYDKHLLSKIGKPNSPPRLSCLNSGDVVSPGVLRPPHAKDGTNLHRLTGTDSASPLDPISRWMTSPASAGTAPGPKPGWRDFADYRSPSVDSSAPSSAVDSDHYARLRDTNRGSMSGPRLSVDDTPSLSSRSNRGSYDQQACLTEADTEAEPDFPIEETGGFRTLNLDDRTPPHNSSQPFSKQQGQKRRALSPPAEAGREDKASANGANQASDQYQRSGIGSSYPRSPNPRFHPNHGSVSSTSSASLRNGSYASSVGFSAAGSSMTSISSIDRRSPGGTSPPVDFDPHQESAYGYANSRNPPSLSTRSVASKSPLSQHLLESRSPTVARAMSAHSNVNENRLGVAPRLGAAYLCECCPKKPKKFETDEELRMHMMEKQYKCAFCTNRFKNKNEAERHQNSLHLRRHSWSCAAISGCDAAFHPSTSPTSQIAGGPSDACGYCGEEFSNFPRDWSARAEHLTNVHKFGECNQAKKFFRADHFRQHLKHSHAGTSGKWTNMLENACMKDEPSADALSSTSTETGEPSEATAPSTTVSPTTPSAPTADSQMML